MFVVAVVGAPVAGNMVVYKCVVGLFIGQTKLNQSIIGVV